MFSSGLSLRNNIKEIDNELTAYTISNDARVVILETFKTNLEGTGEGSIQDLIDKHDSQASSISNLETSSTALQERINTFNAALEDGSDGIISTIEQIELNRSGLVSEISTRASAIQVEATARDNAVKAEAVARAKDIAKIGFISTAEAEGILEVGTYPFCFGMGNQSDLNYGLPLPFSYTLQSIAYTSIATTTNHSIIFNIVHYPFNTNEGPTILQNSVAVSGKYTIVSIKAVAPSAGNLVVEIVSTQNLTDDNGKYRLSFILTSNDSL
jgi:hypothetical protein